MERAQQARIGVAYQGDPLDPAAWSGTVRNLVGGLEACGVVVVPVRAEVPAVSRASRALRRGFAIQAGSPLHAAVNTLGARRSLPRDRPLDGLIQIGSGYVLPSGPRTVTWEDMTLAQALRVSHEPYSRLPPRAVRRWHKRQQRIYDRVDACCVASHWARDSVVGDYAIAPDRVAVVGFGRNAAPIDAERDWATPRFLFVGRQWERKNGPGVVRAFARLHAELPHARLDLVGKHPPVEAEGVTGHGTLRFGVPDDRERYQGLMRTATCMVMPSRFEPFGVAHLDAGAAGMPSIGTSVGGAAEAIGGGGIVVAPEDDDALLDAMRRMSDPDRARRMGIAARRHSDNYTWPLVAQRVLRALAPPGVDVSSLAPFVGAPGGAVGLDDSSGVPSR